MLSKALNAKRKEALEKLSKNQKMHALKILTDRLGMNSGEMCRFIEGLDSNAYEECPYEDLADAKEDLAAFQVAVEKQK